MGDTQYRSHDHKQSLPIPLKAESTGAKVGLAFPFLTLWKNTLFTWCNKVTANAPAHIDQSEWRHGFKELLAYALTLERGLAGSRHCIILLDIR